MHQAYQAAAPTLQPNCVMRRAAFAFGACEAQQVRRSIANFVAISRPSSGTADARAWPVMRYLVGFVLVLALGLTGCGETDGTGGSGGNGGIGGDGGSAGWGGEGGDGGIGGLAGFGGEGGGGTTDAALELLELRVRDVAGENVIVGFDPDILHYQAQLPASEGAAVLRVEPEDPTATIEIQHDDGFFLGALRVPFTAPFATVDLPIGRGGELRILVTTAMDTPDEQSSEYVIQVERSGSIAYTWTGTFEPGAGPFNGRNFEIMFTIDAPSSPDVPGARDAAYFVDATLNIDGIGTFGQEVASVFKGRPALGLGGYERWFRDVLIPGDSLFFGIGTGGATDAPSLWNVPPLSEPTGSALYTGSFPLGLDSQCIPAPPCNNAIANYFDGMGGSTTTKYMGNLDALGFELQAKTAEDVFAESCGIAGCHDEIVSQMGLDLISADVAARVTGVSSVAVGCTDRILVVAGDPDGSYLIQKIQSSPDICGLQMPLLGGISSQDIEVLREWIVDLGVNAGSSSARPRGE